MSADQIWVLLTLVGALVFLIAEWLPSGITGLLIMAALILGDVVVSGGIMPSDDIFASLTNHAVLAVASMFVISAGITRTGAVGLFANSIIDRPGSNSTRLYILVLLFVMVASAFMNNTPLVLIFMPLVIGLAERSREAPSKMLIPLSFVSIMGGMCTLIGTSTNIVVASSISDVSDGDFELGMFDFLPMGIVLGSVGAAFLLLFGKRLLPDRASLGLSMDRGIATEYMTELEVSPGSDLVGATISDVFPPEKNIRVLQLIRHDVIRPARRDLSLSEGDLLLVKGEPAAIMAFHQRGDTRFLPAINVDEDADVPSPDGKPEKPRRATGRREPKKVEVTLAEVVLTPGSRWVGRRVRDVKFRERYGVSVFAVQRHGSHLREKVDELRLRTGDILLVQGSLEDLANLRASDNLLVIEGVELSIPHQVRAPIAVIAVLAFVGIAGFAPGMVHVAALASALIMVLGRCLTGREAYHSLDWDVLFLLAGTLALGAAFERCGLARESADLVVSTFGPMGETAVIGAIFLFTAAITQILSNNAAAAIMAPLAYQTGLVFPESDSPMPFVMAVAFGASCCFLTPVGYGTNLLVYGPGGYKFTDFLKIGIPLTLIFFVLATLLIPIIY